MVSTPSAMFFRLGISTGSKELFRSLRTDCGAFSCHARYGSLSSGFPVLFIAKVIIYFSFQDGFYTPLLELAQKSAKLHSSFKLLEEFPQ